MVPQRVSLGCGGDGAASAVPFRLQRAQVATRSVRRMHTFYGAGVRPFLRGRPFLRTGGHGLKYNSRSIHA